jgi:uncharacterized protein (DUF2147 family)
MVFKRVLVLVFSLCVVQSFGQDVLGKWKTIDDNSSKEKSIIELFERDGKVYGRIIRLFQEPGEDQDPVCDECDSEDSRYKKKIIGMEILTNMMKDGDEYSGGEILDPEVGRVYRCKIWLENDDLKVRGYWGPFYRTQTWKRSL